MVMLLKLEATSKTANSMASGGDMQSMHEGMVSREISNHRWDDDPVQGIILSSPTVYAKEAREMGIKVWCLADSSSKFVYNFDIYCGKDLEAEARVAIPRGEATLAHAIVTKLLQGLDNKGHCVVMDIYFSSIDLFKDLALQGTYATGTIMSNRVGLPSTLKNLKL
jgi:hypothetical protein